MRTFAFLVLAAVLAGPAAAVDSGQAFEDPALQERYERMTRELRCLVCQSETIADSNSMLAADLRREVRELLAQGASDDEIRAFMTERYGDFVLYRPPFAPRTWLLWLAPALLLAGGVAVVLLVILRRARAAGSDPAMLEDAPDRR